MSTELFFSKIKPTAIIPSKRDEDGGYDIYACFDKDYMTILPQNIEFIPTGIASTFSSDYRIVLRERGSTGSQGLSLRCGVIDSGYRDEWFVCLNNTINKPIVISKLDKEELQKLDEFKGRSIIVYPYKKAIAQALLEFNPKADTIVVPYSDLCKIRSDRGNGKLGSSNK